jgi:hypothetical protein
MPEGITPDGKVDIPNGGIHYAILLYLAKIVLTTEK